MKKQSIKSILTKARDLILEKGWCQQSLCEADGRMCARGAIFMALSGDPMNWNLFHDGISPPYEKAVMKASGWKLEEDEHSCIADWNNNFETTQEKVIEAFDKAIQKAR